MGLDLVELVLTLEEHFGVRLGDEDLSQAETVGQLCGVVLAALPQTGGSCWTARAFYRLRRETRPDLRPDSQLSAVASGMKGWRTIAKRTGLSRRLPAEARTVRDAIHTLAPRCCRSPRLEPAELEQLVSRRVRRVIATQFGIRPSMVRPESRLVQDLHLD
jgi:Acyl carrier protein